MEGTAQVAKWAGGVAASRRRRIPSVLAIAVSLATAMPFIVRAERIVVQDINGDARPRRTDTGAVGEIGEEIHQLPDLISWSLGDWRPAAPQSDLFTGTWSNLGDFFRLELIFDGLINPPGPVGCCGEPVFEPFRYGPNPLFAYVEIDVDRDLDTGGELEWPDLRFLGNVARYGGLPPSASLRNRAAVDARDLDGDLATAPYVERSGEDFHVEMVGWEVNSAQIQRSDTADWLFGPGENWVIAGHFLHRAHGYSQFSSACCRSGVPIGNYEPLVKVQFSHNVVSDRTTVALVYPLNQQGSAAMTGDPVEDMDIWFTNQNSVSEALWELFISAISATSEDRSLPEFVLIAPWENKNPDDYLDPGLWQVRMVVGGSYVSQEDSLFVWSDIHPDVAVGDFDGSGVVNPIDLALFDAYFEANDGNGTLDADGVANGSIEILDFGPGFSLYDLNYDGLIDDDDRAMVGGPMTPRADYDHDGDVDQVDFGHVQECLTRGEVWPLTGCRNADLDRDGQIGQEDLDLLVECASGPALPADPSCGRQP